MVRAWAAKGIVDNGGFRYDFEGAWQVRELAQAFRNLGFGDVGDACDAYWTFADLTTQPVFVQMLHVEP